MKGTQIYGNISKAAQLSSVQGSCPKDLHITGCRVRGAGSCRRQCVMLEI